MTVYERLGGAVFIYGQIMRLCKCNLNSPGELGRPYGGHQAGSLVTLGRFVAAEASSSVRLVPTDNTPPDAILGRKRRVLTYGDTHG